jgi:S-adenosylmethionine-diacylgycerolhomoserine-N-methlytransferase
VVFVRSDLPTPVRSPGTGRNLERLFRAHPGAAYGGLDACDAMLEVAEKRCPWASFEHGFAENADLAAVIGERPDRILLSYCLSMVRDPAAVIDNARRALSPEGLVVIVDFADCAGLPAPFPGLLRRWLETFHVKPVDTSWLRGVGAHLRFGRGRYWFSATLGASGA